MDGHNSFLVLHSSKYFLDQLSDAQVGILLRALMDYSIDGSETEFEDKFVQSVYSMMVDQIYEHHLRWLEKCETNRKNIRARWEKERAKEDTNVYDRIPPNTNYTNHTIYTIYTDKDKDKDKDKDIGEDNTPPVIPLTEDKPSKSTKHKYGEYKHVMLTDAQYQKIQVECGELTEAAINVVDKYCEANGKTYKNYSIPVLDWGLKRAKENSGQHQEGKLTKEQERRRQLDKELGITPEYRRQLDEEAAARRRAYEEEGYMSDL